MRLPRTSRSSWTLWARPVAISRFSPPRIVISFEETETVEVWTEVTGPLGVLTVAVLVVRRTRRALPTAQVRLSLMKVVIRSAVRVELESEMLAEPLRYRTG